MLGFLGIFGRSREVQRLDQAVRAVGLHPRLVPDAVKLTTLNLLKEEAGSGASPSPRAYDAAAEMLGFCMLGPQGFTEANGLRLTEAAEGRLEAALEAGDQRRHIGRQPGKAVGRVLLALEQRGIDLAARRD